MAYVDQFCPLVDETMRAALRELRDAGDGMKYMHFRAGFTVAGKLAAAGLATVDDGPLKDAFIRITVAGRLAILDSQAHPPFK